MYRVLNNVSPTEDEVREWGFDDDLLFTDQDEDLLLHDNRYVAVLWELACDPECPKNEYCLSILTKYCKSLFWVRNVTLVREIGLIIGGAKETLPLHPNGWHNDFNHCKFLLDNPKRIDLNEADRIAHYLLSFDDYANIERIGVTRSGLIEYTRPGEYAVYLYIDLSSAKWVVSRFQRLPDSTQ